MQKCLQINDVPQALEIKTHNYRYYITFKTASSANEFSTFNVWMLDISNSK
jgi:hypothetical protein